jgi:molybdate/tungstate transport system permease protein
MTLVSVTPWRHLQLAWRDDNAIAVSMGLGILALAIIMHYWHSGGMVAFAGHRTQADHWRTAGDDPAAHSAAGDGNFAGIGVRALRMFGRWLSLLGATLVNNPAAFVLAQVYGALPYFIVVARSACNGA